MGKKRLRLAQKKEICHEEPNPNDFISQMPNEILLMILSLLPIKYAVITGILSTRWRFLWTDLNKLKFDGTESLDMKTKRWRLIESERPKFINQVNRVIQSYKHTMVQEFRIRFNLDYTQKNVINKWIKFAINKKVETIELDLMDRRHKVHYPGGIFDFTYSDLFKWPLSHATVGSLKKLLLKNVCVREPILDEFLKSSPHLETISIHTSGYLRYIRVGGRTLKLKHFEIVNCLPIKDIYLFDFDLESFTYKGLPIELRLTRLPKLNKLEMGQGNEGLNNNVFRQISSCALSLQALSFNIPYPKTYLQLDSIPNLPNVKKLSLTIGARKDECLLEFASIATACPSLETFTVQLHWLSPIRSRREAKKVAIHPHEHLKLFQILGYYGRISDFDLAAYFIQNAVVLKKVVIDPRWQAHKGINGTEKDYSKCEQATRSYAWKQLTSIMPRGVELAIVP